MSPMGFIAAVAVDEGVAASVLVAALTLGLRHGFDWDHVAAISDITATTDRHRGIRFGTVYALGHAAVVLVLGTAAVLAGSRLPPSIDAVMGRVAGVTLLALGAVVLISVIRDRGRFHATSRWLLLIGHVRALVRRVLRRTRAPLHEHHHTHRTVDAEYTGRTSFGIGMIHGVGAETPTQLLVFLAAANAGGTVIGLAVLVVFVAGLLVSNSVVTVVGARGFGLASARPAIQVTFALATTVISLVLGVSLLVGTEAPLPPLVPG
jgi:high-affinity nickel-transport protein